MWIAVVYYGENKWGLDAEVTGDIYRMEVFFSKTQAQAWAEELCEEWYCGDPWTVDKSLPVLYGIVRRVRVKMSGQPQFGTYL